MWTLLMIVVVALLLGWLGPKILNYKAGFWMNFLVAVAGSILGGWITSLIMHTNLAKGFNLTSVVVAFLGGLLAIIIYRAIKKK